MASRTKTGLETTRKECDPRCTRFAIDTVVITQKVFDRPCIWL